MQRARILLASCLRWVRQKGDTWLKCDDDEVSPVHEEDVLKLSGGGDWHTAYLLLYAPRYRRLSQPAMSFCRVPSVPLVGGISGTRTEILSRMFQDFVSVEILYVSRFCPVEIFYCRDF